MKYDVGDEFAFVAQRFFSENKEWKKAFSTHSESYGKDIQNFLVYCSHILSDIGKHNIFKPGSFTRKGSDGTAAISCNSSDIDIDFGLNNANEPVFSAKNNTTGAVFNVFYNGSLYGSSPDINGCYFFKKNGDSLEIHYYDKEAIDAVKPSLNGNDIMSTGRFSAYGISPDEHVFCPLDDFSYGEFLRDSDYFDKLMPSLLENEKNQGKSR